MELSTVSTLLTKKEKEAKRKKGGCYWFILNLYKKWSGQTRVPIGVNFVFLDIKDVVSKINRAGGRREDTKGEECIHVLREYQELSTKNHWEEHKKIFYPLFWS
jgi:hypothetical protein